MSDIPEVLFVCVHNAGRSQMAAALLDHYAAGRVRVRSAGSAPAETIDPAFIAVMDELGLDLSEEFPKPLTTEAVQAADVVVTMGCGDACPVFRVSATSTGGSTTRRASRSIRSAGSATRSIVAPATCSPNSSPPDKTTPVQIGPTSFRPVSCPSPASSFIVDER